MRMTRLFPLLVAALAGSMAQPGTPLAQSSDTSPRPAREADKIFATTCGWCHNKGGREAGKGPQLMDTALSDAEIEQRIRRGKQGFMPSFEGAFSDAELKGLVAYIRALKPQ